MKNQGPHRESPNTEEWQNYFSHDIFAIAASAVRVQNTIWIEANAFQKYCSFL